MVKGKRVLRGRGRSRSSSRSASSSRSRSPSASPSPLKKRIASKAKKSCGKAKKGYTVIATNIDMIPADMRQAYCRKCAADGAGKKVKLVEADSKVIKMCGSDSYAIMGPCSRCKRSLCCFVSKKFIKN
jgi:hypothetical protein